MLTSHIDTLLDRQGVTLHELMDEDDILQECKAQNKKLLDFLLKPEIMSEMVDLITVNVEQEDEKAKYKYSSTACELLTSDVAQIIDGLIAENILLDKIYQFLESEQPLNPLLASFFSKVLALLIARRGEYMYEYLKNKKDFVPRLLQHIGTSAIMDLLLRLITCVDPPEAKTKVLQWLSDEQLIEKLVALIGADEEESKHCNASLLLCDIVRMGREQLAAEEYTTDPLLDKIECDTTIAALLDNVVRGCQCESVVTSGLAIVQTIIEFRRQLPEGANEPLPAREVERVNRAVDMAVAAVVPRLQDLLKILHEPPKQFYTAMDTTIGRLSPPFGNTRLQVTRLLTSLLALKKPELHTHFAKLGIVNTLLNFFFEYHWNNFLHSQVVSCIHSILTVGTAENESAAATVIAADAAPGDAPAVQTKESFQLAEHLFNDCRLVQRIVDAWDANTAPQLGSSGQRKAYMGHLIFLANVVAAAADKGPYSSVIKDLIAALPEDYCTRWSTFVTTALSDVNKRNETDLVKGHPMRTSSEDEDGDRGLSFPQDSALQQAFSDYQLQQMTSTFIDQFGFNEEEFIGPEEKPDVRFQENIAGLDFSVNANEDSSSKNQFEQACSARIAAFDDGNSSSDEDVWDDKEVVFESTSPQHNVSIEHHTSKAATSDDAMHESSSEDDEDDDGDEQGDRSSSTCSASPRPSSSDSSQQRVEKMDVDNAWSLDDEADEPEPVDGAAVGSSSPWDAKPDESSAAAAAAPNDGWASFSSEPANASDENWADFSKFKPDESSESCAPGPRSSSPDSIDEMSELDSRRKAYVVQSEVTLGNSLEKISSKEGVDKALMEEAAELQKGAGEAVPKQSEPSKGSFENT